MFTMIFHAFAKIHPLAEFMRFLVHFYSQTM